MTVLRATSGTTCDSGMCPKNCVPFFGGGRHEHSLPATITDMNIGTNADGLYIDPTGLYNQVIAKRTEASLPTKLGVR